MSIAAGWCWIGIVYEACPDQGGRMMSKTMKGNSQSASLHGKRLEAELPNRDGQFSHLEFKTTQTFIHFILREAAPFQTLGASPGCLRKKWTGELGNFCFPPLFYFFFRSIWVNTCQTLDPLPSAEVSRSPGHSQRSPDVEVGIWNWSHFTTCHVEALRSELNSLKEILSFDRKTYSAPDSIAFGSWCEGKISPAALLYMRPCKARSELFGPALVLNAAWLQSIKQGVLAVFRCTADQFACAFVRKPLIIWWFLGNMGFHSSSSSVHVELAKPVIIRDLTCLAFGSGWRNALQDLQLHR